MRDSQPAPHEPPGPVWWSLKYEQRRKVVKRWRRIYNVPIAKRSDDVLRRALKQGDTVLDFGAHDCDLKKRIQRWGFDCRYRSLDVDERREHDYRSIDDVDEPIDCIVCQHVLEHLSLAEGYELVGKFFDKLGPGGRVVIELPNIYHPTHFWEDPEHRTFYAYAELGALVTIAGFRLVTVNRIYNDSVIRKFFRRVVLNPLFRLLSVDFAIDIIAVGEKPVE